MVAESEKYFQRVMTLNESAKKASSENIFRDKVWHHHEL